MRAARLGITLVRSRIAYPLDGCKRWEHGLRNLVWGIVNGWFGATGVVVFPLVLTLIADGDLSALDDLGGVGPYVLWCYTAGTVGGAIVGAGRRFLGAPIGRGIITGLVTAVAFGTQVVMLWTPEDSTEVLNFLLPASFVIGFIMSPLVRRGFSSWPQLDGFLDGLVLSHDPDLDNNREDGDTGSSP